MEAQTQRLDPQRHARSLKAVERLALAVASACNRSPWIKRFSHLFSVTTTYRLITLLSGPRVHTLGLDRLMKLERSRGLLIAPNHRSFFDLFLVMAAIEPLARGARRMYFPVRSSFWYDSIPGLLLNALATGMSMYPPVFRAAPKRDLTRAGLDFLATELEDPGVLVGMHPEGTRSRGPDPYELLGPEQSFGRVVLRAKPVVIPVFVNGVGNSLLQEWLTNVTHQAPPIIVAFGEPINLAEFDEADPTRLRAQIAVGQRVLAAIRELGVAERNHRRSLLAAASKP